MGSDITIENRDEILEILSNVGICVDCDLTTAIQRCGRKFIEDLFMLSQLKDETAVSSAAAQLLQEILNGLLLEKCIPPIPNPGGYGYGYGYGGYGYGGYGYGGYGYGGYGYGGYGYGGYGYGGYGYGGYGYGGYGYGGYGYGGYGYGGYGYGGYGYGGYGYGGYGYGGYGYGGYGYGGYGYGGDGYGGYGGGYGYGGYGYGGYGYGYCEPHVYKLIPSSSRKNPEENKELWNNDEFIWLNQIFAVGVRNSEGLVWAFKDSNNRFSPEEGREILQFTTIISGDHDQGLFRAVAHAAINNPIILEKIVPR